MKWSVTAYASTYRCGSRCDCCLTEKYVISRANHKELIHQKNLITFEK